MAIALKHRTGQNYSQYELGENVWAYREGSEQRMDSYTFHGLDKNKTVAVEINGKIISMSSSDIRKLRKSKNKIA